MSKTFLHNNHLEVEDSSSVSWPVCRNRVGLIMQPLSKFLKDHRHRFAKTQKQQNGKQSLVFLKNNLF